MMIKINLKNLTTEEELLKFIDNGGDINHLFNADKNALFTANYEKAMLLIKYGIKWDHADNFGVNALMWNKDIAVCRMLIERGLSIHHLDKQGQNALFYATPEKAKMFVDLGININQVNRLNQNALFTGRLNTAKSIFLIESGINVHHIDKDKENILFKKGSLEVVKKALEKGVNPNQINIHNRNPLFCSSAGKVELLIQYGVNINHIDNEGENALFCASSDSAKILIENNIDYSIVNKAGKTIIFDQAHNSKKLEIFYNAGIDLNVINKEGNTILWDCARYSSKIKTFKKLIDDFGVDLNVVNKKGENCAFALSAPQLSYAIEKGIDCNLVNDKGFDITYRAPTDKMHVILEESNYKPSENGLKSISNSRCNDKVMVKLFKQSVIAKGGLNEEEFEKIIELRSKSLPYHHIDFSMYREALREAETEILNKQLKELSQNEEVSIKKRL